MLELIQRIRLRRGSEVTTIEAQYSRPTARSGLPMHDLQSTSPRTTSQLNQDDEEELLILQSRIYLSRPRRRPAPARHQFHPAPPRYAPRKIGIPSHHRMRERLTRSW
jgi:hypothetical protein